MSARLTDEQWAQHRAWLLTMRPQADLRQQEAMDRILADRAAILESERDLLAALEAMVSHYVTDDDPDLLWACDKQAIAAIANARRQDTITTVSGVAITPKREGFPGLGELMDGEQ